MGKRTRGVAAALLTVTVAGASVHAADLGGGRRLPPVRDQGFPSAPTQIERWTGFYFGAGIGYGFGDTGVEGASGAFSIDSTGGIGTLFAGYNWQLGRTVVGLEADIGTGNLGGSGIGAHGAISHEFNALGSLRARAGVLVAPSLLLYATAGLAWADIDFKLATNATRSETLTGYQLGFGGEMMIAPQWTLRLEYLYTDLGKENVVSGGIGNRFDPDYHTVRAGIAFKF